MPNSDSSDNVDLMLQNPKKALIRISIPIIVSFLINSFYNVVDTAWVSGLGADALAGVGFFTPIFMILLGFGIGLGSGATFALAKYLGEGDKQKADNASFHSILITIIVSLIVTVVLLIFLRPILDLMGAGQTIDYAMDYGVSIVLGSIIVILSNSLYGIFRGEGDTKRPMYAMAASTILNLILDPIFIYMLNLGVRGAAIATLISVFVMILIFLYLFYIKKDTYIKPLPSNFHFKRDISLDIIKVGIPVSVQLLNNAFFAALFSLLLTYVGSTDAVAVYSTGWRIVTIGLMPILAIGAALISVIAANYGAKNYKNIQIAHRYSMKISFVIAVIIAILTNVFAPHIASIFTSADSSARIASQLTSFLSWIVIFYPAAALGISSTYVFQAIGRGLSSLLQTVMRETIFSLFFAVLFSFILGYGVWGAWMGIIVGELIANNITTLWANYIIKKLMRNNG